MSRYSAGNTLLIVQKCFKVVFLFLIKQSLVKHSSWWGSAGKVKFTYMLLLLLKPAF